ncbi:MAG TPA: hypothetical protein DEB06_06850 [Phycisphaerales bacterium]|nr:hypothetical protein [Phycisphaerales bacterium]
MKNHTMIPGAVRVGPLALALGLAGASVLAATPTVLPGRPEEIAFRPLSFEPPRAAEHRRTLSNGVPVYILPSSEFPLVQVVFSFKGGRYLEPGDKAGLADMTGAMLRRGGTQSMGASALDEQLDFLAAQVSTNFGATAGTATLNSLKSNFDEAFGLFMDILRKPAFEPEKVDLYRKEVLEGMKQRNDDRSSIFQQQVRRMVWGPDHFEGREPTKQAIDSITIDDMRAFHQRVVHPGNLIIGVTGDVTEAEIMSRLEAAMSGWDKGQPVPKETDTGVAMKPGVFYVEKDVPQGQVFIGHRGIRRDDPDAIPVMVMNDILGGAGFTARLIKRIRDDEGLSYGVNSSFQQRVEYPGVFATGFTSKSRTVALATKIALQEIEKMRSAPVSQEELDVSKKSFIDTFPRTFESKAGTLNVFITDEWTNRPKDYWQTYRQKVESVTVQDVQNAAAKHLRPENFAIMVVGKWEDIAPGDPTEQRPDYKAQMSDFGTPVKMPLLDPMTLQPLPDAPRKD